MTRILRRQKSGYLLGGLFCFLGLLSVFFVFWKIWARVFSAQDVLSTFWALIWSEQVGFIAGVDFKLAYMMILGFLMFFAGVTVWLLSRQWFTAAGETVLLRCSFCNRRWRAKRDEGLVHCPHCRQLVHARMIDK